MPHARPIKTTNITCVGDNHPRRPVPKAEQICEFPQPLYELEAEPATFSDALTEQMRRHGDSFYQLHKAIVRPRDHFDRRTILDWVNCGCVPRNVKSMAILTRIERRYRLPTDYFKRLLPHQGRASVGHKHLIANPAERRRLAWHLPDDFDSRTPAERAAIVHWVRVNILGGATEYGLFQLDAMKHPFGLRFSASDGDRRKRPKPTELTAPAQLQKEMDELVHFKTAALPPIGMNRNGTWGHETRDQRIEHLSLLFGAMSSSRVGPVGGLGVPIGNLTFALLVLPSTWDWYLNWRLGRRGFFTAWEVDMLRLGMAICRRETGWLRQSPHLADHLDEIPDLLSLNDANLVKNDWEGACDRLSAYANSRVKEVARVARVHRDPFEPILPVLEASNPVSEYRAITEEIARRIPDDRVYPKASAEAVRAFLMLRLGLHLGIRQRNLRELLLCPPGSIPRSERELERRLRGELRWIEKTRQWEVFIPSAAFKNGRSSFFANQPFRLTLPDLAGLYSQLDRYVRKDRSRLLGSADDPETVFVKSVSARTVSAAYNCSSFYEAWRSSIQRYGIWNPYTKRGAIPGLLPHGPHCVRDVLATHVLKQTGSYEQAGYAIQDTPATVAKHYGRFLPQDKVAIAANVLNKAWT